MLVSSLSSRAAPHSGMHQLRPASAVPDWNVLPIENSTLNSSEWMASQAMTAFLQDIRKKLFLACRDPRYASDVIKR